MPNRVNSATGRRSWRPVLLTLHRWPGLMAGAIFALLGLTGSVLVFYVELDAQLNPNIASSGAAPDISLDAVERTLRQNFPERDGPWRIELPLAAERPVLARYYKPLERVERQFAPLMVTLDPQTLAVTSHRLWGDTAMTWVYDLHYSLLLDRNGTTVVGVLGIASGISILSGLYLWLPSRRRLFQALRYKRNASTERRLFDIHALSGVYSAIVLLAIALTGAGLALPNFTRSVLGLCSPVTQRPAPRTVTPELAPTASLDAASATARARFDSAQVRWVETSGARGTPIVVRLKQSGEPSSRFPQTFVWLDARSGEVLSIHDPARNSASDTVLDWLHPLHNGEAFGMPGRILVAASGCIPLALFVTGFLRWNQKRRVARRTRTGATRNTL